MNTGNQNTMNITQRSVYGKCNLKCSFSSKYEISNSSATNNDIYVSVSYDKQSMPPVVFNYQKYNVSTIKIYSPSLHSYDGTKVQGEIIIEHQPVTSGSVLNVCIPIVQSSDNSKAGQIVSQIIEKVSANAPSKGNTTKLNLDSFTLQNIIPNKPYFNYTNQAGVNHILFSKLDAIPVSQTLLTSLSKIIKPFQLTIPETKLFFNSDGPNTKNDLAKEGIYISCNPTGDSEETTNITNNKIYSFDVSTLFNNQNMINFVSFLIIPTLILAILMVFQILKKYSFNDIAPPVNVISNNVSNAFRAK
uniref:Alpha-carbonic anhydrase domain-containing protein n=1 Tax=viral metagenome TaxID=1070528 RepID=A0A6C0E8J7_9ZZZZ